MLVICWSEYLIYCGLELKTIPHSVIYIPTYILLFGSLSAICFTPTRVVSVPIPLGEHTNTPILRRADSNLTYELTADTSHTGVGAVLTQTGEEGPRPVAYASRKLKPAEQNSRSHERGLLAIVYALHTWRPYLHGARFRIKTDHHPLKYLDTQKTLSRNQARWVELMQEIDYNMDYIKGKSNIVADALSQQYNETHHQSTELIKKLMTLTKTQLSETALNRLKDEYEKDAQIIEMYNNPIEPYHKKGLRLYLDDKLYLPNGQTRQTVLMDTHDSLFGAHRGFKETLSLIKTHF